MCPLAFRNFIVGKDFAPLAANVGITFYEGNNKNASGLYMDPPGLDIDRDFTGRKIAEYLTGASLKPSGVSRFWMQEAWKEIRHDPFRFFRVMCLKTVYYWNRAEIPNPESYPYAGHFSTFFSMPLPGFPVAGIFGLVGMAVVLLRRRNEATILLLFVLGHMASVVMFFVSARYRISVIPVLLIFASVAVADLADLLRKKHYKKMGLYGIEVGVAALVVYFPWKGLDDKYLSALTDNNLGLFYAANNDANRALGHFESAIRTCPSFWKTYNNLGNLYLSAGSKENALALYEKGLRMGLPEDSSAMFLHMSLGIFYLKNGDTVRAKSHFRIAMPYVPYSIMIWQLRPNAFRKLPL